MPISYETVRDFVGGSPPLEELFKRLQAAEAVARARLEQGWAEDVASLDRFFDRSLSKAQAEARDAMAGFGTLRNGHLSRNLRRDLFDEIAMRCVERCYANAKMRFRARAQLYTGELSHIEATIASVLLGEYGASAQRVFPRMFSLPHIVCTDIRLPDEPSDDSTSELAAWAERLRACIRGAFLRQVEQARQKVCDSGARRVAIVRVRLRLAFHHA